MKILFLDDDVLRHEAFLREHPSDTVTRASTVEETLVALEAGSPFDVVYLDHDLEGRVFVEEIEGTGCEIAFFIARLPDNKLPKLVIVHSHNPAGARRMVEALQGRVPVRHEPF